MDHEKLAAIIKDHAAWRADNKKGSRANLRGADLAALDYAETIARLRGWEFQP